LLQIEKVGASVFLKILKKGRPKRGQTDGKQDVMIDAGIRLLARKDYEALSMARIAQEAGCSVGALYARFPDKNSYLYHAISAAFRSMQHAAGNDLAGVRWGPLPPRGRVDLLVDHAVSTMTSPRGAGMIRAAIKLATIRPDAMKPFEEYRSAVSYGAVTILAIKGAKAPTPGEVRFAMQIVFATVTDAVLQKQPGPMTAESDRMKSALINIMVGYLGISKKSGWSGVEAKGEDEPVEDDVVEDASRSENATFDPDLRVMRRSKVPADPRPPKRKAKRASNVSEAKVPVQAPPKVPKTKDSAEPQPRRRRKHTVV
jgi:AcrR family transcriptional regulator